MKTLLTAIALAVILSTSVHAESLLSVVDKAIKQAVMKETNDPVAHVKSTEIIRPIHVLTALKNQGVTNVKLTTVIAGVEYKIKYTFRGSIYRLTVINEGSK